MVSVQLGGGVAKHLSSKMPRPDSLATMSIRGAAYCTRYAS
jgi:hypothetical protein